MRKFLFKDINDNFENFYHLILFDSSTMGLGLDSKLNLTSFFSKIEDINMATAAMKSVKDSILVNSNQCMLVSARQNNENLNMIFNK